jgi:hypothetical protein
MADDPIFLPRWISSTLEIKEGRDPLGLQTTTQDRLMPLLLPGVLELSVRARYLSFHAFLLDEYRRRRLPADNRSLSIFIKHREWEFGLAVLSCPHECGSVPVGADRLRPLMRQADPPYQRGESVESALGGYGLYYRSPLAEFGIVARAGTLLGDRPTTVDVLSRGERAGRVAAAFRSAIEPTEYYQRWMLSTDPLPVEVLRDYGAVACLCRLPHLTEERHAVHDALFGSDPASTEIATTLAAAVDHLDDDTSETLLEERGTAVVQRRRSFAHYLSILEAHPAVVEDQSAYREALWSSPALRGDGHALVAGHWSALIAKDVWQDAICSVWSDFCRTGLAQSRDLGRGLTWAETEALARGLVTGPPDLDPDTATAELAEDIAADRIGVDGDLRPAQADLESLRRWTVSTDTATSGLIVALELDRRAAEQHGHGWKLASGVRSRWQPSVSSVREGLHTQLAERATTADTLWWLVDRFVLHPHERIAYSKLPEFTFRFRWEEGLLRFFDHGIGRFPLAAIRMRAFGSLSYDLGLWDRESDGAAALSPRGRSFLSEVLG